MPDNVELKRIVMVKAIVTEALKESLAKEIDRALQNVEAQTAQTEMQSAAYLDELKHKSLAQKAAAFKQQLDEERARQGAARADLLTKMEEVRKLQLGTEFAQGPLEGPVTVRVGDNLYKKVGGAEIVVVDGLIREIRGTE
jgi:hypothetical protein